MKKELNKMNSLRSFLRDIKSTLFSSTSNAATTLCFDILQDSKYDNNVKQDCFNKLIEKVVRENRKSCAVGLIYSFFSQLEDYFSMEDGFYFPHFISFVRQVFCHPNVVESFITACKGCNSNIHFLKKMLKDVNIFSQMFDDESVIRILRGNPRKKIFVLFGCHPAMSKHVDLQKKWIRYCSRYLKLNPFVGIRNITNEALQSAPLKVAFPVIKRCIASQSAQELKNYMQHLDLNVVKSIILTHIVTYGRNEEISSIAKKIKEIKDEAEPWSTNL